MSGHPKPPPSLTRPPGGNPYGYIDQDVEEALERAGAAEGQRRPLARQLPLVYETADTVTEAFTQTSALLAQPSGNPYARDVEPKKEAPKVLTGISIAEFEARSRAVFRPYMPTWMRKGPLHAHYRDFIARNRSRSPTARERIVAQLEKYALSDLPGLATQFNRERQVLTENKLKKIERLAEHDDQQ